MITLTCDKCDKQFQVGDDQAGGKAFCPFCSDVKMVPAMGQPVDDAAKGSPSPASNDRALALGLPPGNGPEVMVMEIQGAMFRSRPFTYIGVVILLLASVTCAIWLTFKAQYPISIACSGVAVVCLTVLLVWKINSLSERLRITTRRVVLSKGMMSKSSIEMLHRTMQDIEIVQTFMDRVWRVGKMTISNAGQEDDEIIIQHVPNPYRVREIIDAYRPL